MTIHVETRLREFDFWAGAADHVKYLTWGQLDEIEAVLEDIYPDGLDDTTLNDLLWFDEDIIAEWLGFESFEALMEDSMPWDE
jgi:hypothetical protein